MAKETKAASVENARPMMDEKTFEKAARLRAEAKALQAKLLAYKDAANVRSFSLMFKAEHIQLPEKLKEPLRDLAVKLVEERIASIKTDLEKLGVKLS